MQAQNVWRFENMYVKNMKSIKNPSEHTRKIFY